MLLHAAPVLRVSRIWLKDSLKAAQAAMLARLSCFWVFSQLTVLLSRSFAKEAQGRGTELMQRVSAPVE